jgi:tetratricopeptide (TPR) repeat protein
MLGLCHRERGDLDEAVAWLRKALEAPGGSGIDDLGIRYELADVLVASGDVAGALATFREILAVDPGFRDVAARVGSLRASPHS